MRFHDFSMSHVFCEANGRVLHVANAGDSRAVLIKSTGAIRLTKDHKAIGKEVFFSPCFFLSIFVQPTDPDEKKEIESRGGIVMNGRISGILGVSRSLGDYRAERYVNRFEMFHPWVFALSSNVVQKESQPHSPLTWMHLRTRPSFWLATEFLTSAVMVKLLIS